MHEGLKCITIMQCIMGNPMQIVLWRVTLNYVLGAKKRGKTKVFFFFLTVCSVDFRATTTGDGLKQLFDIQKHVQLFSVVFPVIESCAKRMELCKRSFFVCL